MSNFLNCLNDSVGTFKMHFASSKCNILLQDCIGSKRNFVLAREELFVTDEFRYLDSDIPRGGRMSHEMSLRIQKTRLISVISDYRLKIEDTQQLLGRYCFTAPKHGSCEQKICEDF